MPPKTSPQQPQLPGTRTDAEYAEILKPAKTIRLAVSGDVLLTKLEVRLIDTADFQRLRRVRQLGTACLVYPTALHTRFDHSIGTMHMACRMMEAIQSNSHSAEDERTIHPLEQILTRLYALLHDVPHVPFGHTLEDELGILGRHDENQARITRFFGPSSEIGTIIREFLGADGLDRFLTLYTWDKTSALPYDDGFVYDIVSNTVCADLLDYLARDNFFCNLGVSLEYRFLNFLYLHRDKSGSKRVFVRLFKLTRPVARRDTLTDLCRLMENRYLIAERVYFHHAKVAASAMLGRAVFEAKEAGELDETQMYEHSDDSLSLSLKRSAAVVASELGRALADRRLHKLLHKFGADEFEAVQSNDQQRPVREQVQNRLKSPAERRKIENEIAAEVGGPEGSVLLYCPPDNMNMKLARMKVVLSGGEIELSEVRDPLIQPRLKEILEAHKRLWGVWVFVDSRLDPNQRQLIRQKCALEFVTSSAERDARTKQYYELLVDRQLKNENRSVGSIPEFYNARAAVVEDLVATTKDDRLFQTRLKDSIAKRYPPVVEAI